MKIKLKTQEVAKKIKGKDEKAITLIALVITIIVLLILAAISIGAIFGENGLLAKAQLAGFATEMKQIEENVRLKQAEIQANNASGEGSTELFSTKLNENDVTIPDTLKQEVLYTRDGMQDLTSPKDYEVDDFNNLLDAEGNVANIYIIDKETGNGKENTYVYDETTDTVYKIPQTNIGGQVYHSYECAEKGKGGTSSGGESGPGGEQAGETIDKESDVIQVGEEYYYAPNMKGFSSKDTYLVYYTNDFSEEKDVPVEEYIADGEPAKIEENYTLHDYGNAIWANAKTLANNLESWWVWIPRYAYKINGQDAEIPIDVIYIGLDDKPLNPKYKGILPEGYEPHPAFKPSGTDGSKNLKGIWMSKYEPSLTYQNRATTEEYYAPDMTGFDKEHTYIELYDSTTDEFIDEKKLSEVNLNTINNEKKWYDYQNNIWANIKTDAHDLESWWVWVPRYAYKIEITGVIDIIYIDLEDKPINKEKYGEELPEGYTVHPAFKPSGTDGSKNLKGIWMSKYEPSLTYKNRATTEEYYAPDMEGFDKEHTYIELYDSTTDEFIDEKKLSEVNLNTINNEKKWYDYQNNIWANIKTDANDLEAWWVWVPRYAYKIEITGVIDIIYIDLEDKPINKEKYGEELPEGYTVHPAFKPSGTDGSKNLKGIWMSKYEPSNKQVGGENNE